MLRLLVLAAAATAISSAATYPVESCDVSDLPYSCLGSVSDSETCCYEQYGIIMQTQFWDYDSDYLDSSKREDKVQQFLKRTADNDGDVDEVFTIHGLWDDLCDGSYKSECDSSLAIGDDDDLQTIIANDFGKQDLYDTMSKYWINNEQSNVEGDSNEELWKHEYNKHGTCFNTIKPACFTGDYQQFEAAVYFFQKVVEVWEGLPTYKFLADEGITPSADQKYALSDIQLALSKNHDGKEVYVGCLDNAINQIYYYHVVRGNVLTGDYKAVDSLETSNCGSEVWYLPKK